VLALYPWLLLLKLSAVLVYAGGYLAAYVADDVSTRKRAAHRIASPALLVTWLSGFGLLMLMGLPLFEAWTVVPLLLSVLANGVVTFLVERDVRKPSAWLAPAFLVVVIVGMMVFKPTWNHLLP
jgi:hypothetical protein